MNQSKWSWQDADCSSCWGCGGHGGGLRGERLGIDAAHPLSLHYREGEGVGGLMQGPAEARALPGEPNPEDWDSELCFGSGIRLR